MKFAVAVLLLTCAFFSCTKEKQSGQFGIGATGAGPGNQAAPGQAQVPEIVSAFITPEAPTANTPLSMQYDGHGMDNEPVQYLFRWHVNDSIVQEGPKPTLEPGSYRKGSSVFVEIVISTAHATGKPFRTAARTISNLPPSIVSLDVHPDKPVVGDTLTVTPAGQDPDGDLVSYLYQWTVNDKPVTDVVPDINTFSTAGLKKNDVIVVVVTPTDGETMGEKKLSQDVVIRNSLPRIISTPPTTVENEVYVYQVAAKDPDGDALTYYLVEAPTGMTIESKTGLIRWEPPKKTSGTLELPVKILVDDGDGGRATQEYSLVLEPR